MKKRAYGKINLGLKVISKRKDGYHDLEMIMTRISLYDELEFIKNDKIEVSCQEVKMENNLVYKVALYLQNKYKVDEGIKIIINKRIPIEAGLGGGSSDAACTINALNKIWKLRMSLEEKKKVADLFGSDIAFFIEGKTAFVGGKGEAIRKLGVSNKLDLLLIKPNFGFSTKEVFSKVTFYSEKGMLKDLEAAWLAKDVISISKKIENDLEKGLETDSAQQIKAIKDSMLKENALNALMSGSGSSVFGIFDDKKTCEKAYAKFQKEGYQVYKIKSIG